MTRNKKLVKMMALAVAASTVATSVPAYAAFDATYYAQQNPDVVAAIGTKPADLEMHYNVFGKKEGRAGSADEVGSSALRQLFDAEYYAKLNPDVVAVYGNDANALFNHFLQFGIKEGRKINPYFDVNAYKKAYPDLVAAFGDDIAAYYNHFATNGIKEHRTLGGFPAEKIVPGGVAVASSGGSSSSSGGGGGSSSKPAPKPAEEQVAPTPDPTPAPQPEPEPEPTPEPTPQNAEEAYKEAISSATEAANALKKAQDTYTTAKAATDAAVTAYNKDGTAKAGSVVTKNNAATASLEAVTKEATGTAAKTASAKVSTTDAIETAAASIEAMKADPNNTDKQTKAQNDAKAAATAAAKYVRAAKANVTAATTAEGDAKTALDVATEAYEAALDAQSALEESKTAATETLAQVNKLVAQGQQRITDAEKALKDAQEHQVLVAKEQKDAVDAATKAYNDARTALGTVDTPDAPGTTTAYGELYAAITDLVNSVNAVNGNAANTYVTIKAALVDDVAAGDILANAKEKAENDYKDARVALDGSKVSKGAKASFLEMVAGGIDADGSVNASNLRNAKLAATYKAEDDIDSLVAEYTTLVAAYNSEKNADDSDAEAIAAALLNVKNKVRAIAERAGMTSETTTKVSDYVAAIVNESGATVVFAPIVTTGDNGGTPATINVKNEAVTTDVDRIEDAKDAYELAVGALATKTTNSEKLTKAFADVDIATEKVKDAQKAVTDTRTAKENADADQAEADTEETRKVNAAQAEVAAVKAEVAGTTIKVGNSNVALATAKADAETVLEGYDDAKADADKAVAALEIESDKAQATYDSATEELANAQASLTDAAAQQREAQRQQTNAGVPSADVVAPEAL